MTDAAAQFTVPAVAKAIAAAIPDRQLLIQGRAALQLRPGDRAIEPIRRMSARAHIAYCKNYSTILRKDCPFKVMMLEIR